MCDKPPNSRGVRVSLSAIVGSALCQQISVIREEGTERLKKVRICDCFEIIFGGLFFKFKFSLKLFCVMIVGLVCDKFQ